MRIAQVAPLHESVPPKAYGGTERVVSYLTEELVRAGHDVTLFASADSVTQAQLVPMASSGLRLDENCVDPLSHHIRLVEEVAKQANRFDIVHYHIDYLHFPLSRRSDINQLTTLHGRLDLGDLRSLFREFSEMPLVSISNAQRKPLPHANWVGTVYHGLPSQAYEPGAGKGGYLAFLGRISPEKRVDRAIQIAKACQSPLRIAAKVSAADQPYFEKVIRPLLTDPLVEFVGEIGETDKQDFLGEARALLFPIDWPEPFGLAMVEAMACATPVVAYRCGSVPEVVRPGLTGFTVEDLNSAVRAVQRLNQLSRPQVRAEFARCFSAERMAQDYVDVYRRLLAQRAQRTARRPRPDVAA